MIDFKVTENGKELSIHFPTSIKEVNFDYLANITKGVAIAPNYALIACAFKEKPITIISQMKQGKNAQVAAVAYFIKAGVNTSDFINGIPTGTAIISAPSDIMLGHQVGVPENPLTPQKLASYSMTNADLYKELMGIVTPVYFISFKIVPINIIHGMYYNEDLDNPFKVINPYVDKNVAE